MLSHVDQEGVLRVLQDGVIGGHYEGRQGEGWIIAGPIGYILHELSVVFRVVGDQAESFVEVNLCVRSQSPIDQLTDRIFTLQRAERDTGVFLL